jgi:hypothetical protein
MSAPQPAGPGWPNLLAAIALAGFALLIPFVALGGMLDAASWFGSTPSEADRIASFWWALTATISVSIALALAVVAAIAGGRAAKVLAFITVPLTLVGLYFYGSITVSAADKLPGDHSPPAVAEPNCGPDSRPPLYGEDSRYSPCDADRRAAEELIPDITAALPTADVATTTVDAAAEQLASEGRTPAASYEGSYELDTGDVVAHWNPAPVTCIQAEWRDGEWDVYVTGALVEGRAC